MTRPPLPLQGDQPPWGDQLNNHIEALGAEVDGLLAAGGGGGPLDHGALTGLTDDDHTQYWNNTRGDAKIAAHASAADPHTGYQKESEKGVANGYAGLDGTGKVPSAQLPAASGGGTVDADLSGSWFANRKWYSLGTSITIDGSYTGRLVTLSGMTLANKGVSGATLSTASNGNIWTALTTQVGTDAEVITIETINDFRLNVPLGTWADQESTLTTYFGALKAACNWILTNRPAARAVFFTAYGDAMNAGYPNGETPNSTGKYYFDYNEAMKVVCARYGIPVLDVGGESGINYHTCQFYTTDMIHMNANGGQRYAEYVWSKLRHMGWLTSRPTAPGAVAPVPVTGIDITTGDFSVLPSATHQLSATISPANASNKTVVWTSSNTGVATVSLDGNVTGVTAGTSTITATSQDGNFTDSVVCTVGTVAVTGVTVTPDTWLANPSDTTQLTTATIPANATNKTVTWVSSAPAVATVSASGLVTAVALGSATITATTAEGGFTDTCAVTVANVPATGVDVSPSTTTVSVGATKQLTATLIPANATNKNVTWSSSDQAKATVSATGLVTGVAAGSVTITATTADGGFTDTCATTVSASDWNLSKATAYTGLGIQPITVDGNGDPNTPVGVWAYGAIFLNSIASGHNAVEFVAKGAPGVGCWLVWGSNQSSVFACHGDANPGISLEACPTSAGLGSTGSATGYTVSTPIGPLTDGTKIRMARLGTVCSAWKWNGSTWAKFLEFDLALSTKWSSNPASYQDIALGLMVGGSYTAAKEVYTGTYMGGSGATVPATGVDVTPATASIPSNGATQLTASVQPASATNKAVNWSSNATGVATVSPSGLVSGVAVGSAVISAVTQDGGFTDTSDVTVTEASAEWVLNPKTSFTGNNLNGVTATGSDPTYTGVTAGTYGWFVLNSAGHNAIEYTVKDAAKGAWLVFGAPVGNTNGTGCGQGDFITAITYNGDFNAGAITLRGGSVTPAWAAHTYGTGKVYRVGRSGNRVVVYRVDPGNVLVKLWDGDLSANFATASKYAEIQLGILCSGGPGSTYSLPINCKSGVWTPPATALEVVTIRNSGG